MRRDCWDCAHDVVDQGDHICEMLDPDGALTEALRAEMLAWFAAACGDDFDDSMPADDHRAGPCPCWAPCPWANLGGEA